MSQAKRLKILLADKQESGIFDGSHRGRIVASIEDGQSRNRTAWPIDTEHLLTSSSRALKDADMAGLNHIQSSTRFTLSEDGFARRKVAGHGTLCKKS